MRYRKASRACSWIVFLVFLLHSFKIQPTVASSNATAPEQQGPWDGRKAALDMFYHAYRSYMAYAFPHDELKPISKSYTDSLGELGNLDLQRTNGAYNGVAMTLIDSLSTLAVLGDSLEFERGVRWLAAHADFDVDLRVNVFEANIRLVGALLSAHLLAVAPGSKLMPPDSYHGELVDLAYDVGSRLLPAFLESPTGLPYGWVNLRHGVQRGRETAETNTAACGSLTIEFGLLSRLTGNPIFEHVAVRALKKLWSMRSPRGLLGTAINMELGAWLGSNGGIGASADSFYEYLLKAYVIFGDEQYWEMFSEAYAAARAHYTSDGWYHDSDIYTGQPTHLQLTSLSAFWPGMQVLAGDVEPAAAFYSRFHSVWRTFGLLPERYLYAHGLVHPSEHYYPLRPELIESTFYLYQATRDPQYQEAGRFYLESLNNRTRVAGGYASVRDVQSGELEDQMHSFFLSETCKYLYLLFDDSFLQGGNYVFTTEGHPIPVADWWLKPSHPAHSPPPASARHRSAATHAGPSAAALFNRTLAMLKPYPQFRGLLDGDWSAPSGPGFWDRVKAALWAGLEEEPTMGLEDDEYEDEEDEEVDCTARLLTSEQLLNWGSWKSNISALDARVCPAFASRFNHVLSTCHVLDRHENFTCLDDFECGRDATSCSQRKCSDFGFCETRRL